MNAAGTNNGAKMKAKITDCSCGITPEYEIEAKATADHLAIASRAAYKHANSNINSHVDIEDYGVNVEVAGVEYEVDLAIEYQVSAVRKACQ